MEFSLKHDLKGWKINIWWSFEPKESAAYSDLTGHLGSSTANK